MVSSHITVLEKKGYIIKEPLEEDRRSFYVIPTEKAVELVRETAGKVNRNLQLVEAVLGEETFANVLEALKDTNRVLKDLNKV